MFHADPPVDQATQARWQADIETVVPRTDRVPWLLLCWEPGLPYEPVGRWELREVIPRSAMDWLPDGVLDALQGPNPRTVGVWHTGDDGIKRWISDSLVSLAQWTVYQQTGCYSSRWWIIQGMTGGHRLKWGPVERAFWKMQGKAEVELPAPGALPYAPYDERVKAQIVRADRMRQWKQALAWDQRATDKRQAAKFVTEHRQAVQREMNRTMLEFMDEQVKAAVSEVSRKGLAQMDHAGPGDPNETEQFERLDQELLQEV